MNKTNINTKKRELFIGCIFSFFFIIVAAKVIYLHAAKGAWLSDKAEEQYTREIVSKGRRGTIYDIKKRELAVSLDAVSVGVNPFKVENPSSAAREIAEVLGLSRRIIQNKLNKSQSFVWLKRQIPIEKADALKALGIKGLRFLPDRRRYYPGTTLAGQVLGFTGVDKEGLEGIERLEEKNLSPKSEKNIFTKDALGRIIKENSEDISKLNGNSVVLTLDSRIQYIAEQALSETVEKYDAKSGIAVVISPSSGAVLAIAHYPEFNPNNFKKYMNGIAWRNRAVTDPFEPGSTMKIFLAAAAIETGACDPNTIFFCENGSYYIGTHRVNDSHPHEWLSLQQIIKYSSNIGAVKVADITGRKTLYETLNKFGFGHKTGIESPAETPGILSNYRRWSKLDTGAIAFGQGISVSSIQLVRAVSAIANGGYLVKPYIISEIIDPSGKVVEKFHPSEARRIISSKTAKTVKRIMASVVTKGGTGVNAALEGYNICGKTGTAQKITKKGGYSNDNYTASFVGFAPEKNPKVTVLVALDEPQKNYYGGTVAAPAFKKIVHETLDYMNVAPEKYNETGKMLYAKRGAE